MLCGKNINISVVSDIDEQYKEANTFDAMTYAVALYKMTNGIDIPAEEFSERALEHIYGEIPTMRAAGFSESNIKMLWETK